MAISNSYPLLAAVAVDTTGVAFTWPGGRGVFSAVGTFGGGTCKLQWLPDGGETWLNVDRSGDTFVTYTADGSGGFELPACSIRAVLSGATTPTLTAKAASSDS